MAPVVAALLELGCEVDVVGDRAIAAIPPGEYQLLVAPPDALGRLAAALPASCVKVLHLNEPDVVFQNAAELDRLLALRDRRGVVLAPVRYRRVGDAFDAADHVVVQGNGWTVSTYRHVGQPIHAVPAVCDVELPSPARKDFERHGGRFVWLGGGGCVHQGLDLVLEAFAQLPGCQLTVCGPVAREEAFAAAYARELYRLPNVKFEGDLGVRGRRFAAVTERATAFILPSGGEGQAVEAVRCLGAGLIPIVSRECGIDVDDFGVVLEESSVLAIKESASAVSALPASRKRDLAMLAWNAARARHAPSVVAARWRDLLAQLLAPVLASVATGGTRRESSSPSSGTPR